MAAAFDIVSTASDGALVVMSEDGARYEYAGATSRDVNMIRRFIRRKDYAHGWKFLSKLRLFSKKIPGGAETAVSDNIFEHVLKGS